MNRRQILAALVTAPLAAVVPASAAPYRVGFEVLQLSTIPPPDIRAWKFVEEMWEQHRTRAGLPKQQHT